MYSNHLAHIHDSRFSDYARRIAPQLSRIIRARGLPSSVVVEVGCGGGVLARRLVDDGFEVHGIDISRAMIRIARARVPEARFRVASLATTRIPACAAVVTIGEVVSYVPGGLQALARFFERVHAALVPGGLLIFDFMESARGRTYDMKSMAGDGWVLAAQASYDRATRILTRRMAMVREGQTGRRHSRETHRVRIYSRQEMVVALRRVGFGVRTARAFGRVRLLRGDVAVITVRNR